MDGPLDGEMEPREQVAPFVGKLKSFEAKPQTGLVKFTVTDDC